MRGERHRSRCFQDETNCFNIHRIDLEKIVNHVVINVHIVMFYSEKGNVDFSISYVCYLFCLLARCISVANVFFFFALSKSCRDGVKTRPCFI